MSIVIPKSVTNIGDEAFGYANYGEMVENFTIYGYAGTAAETYANENGFTFISLEKNENPSNNCSCICHKGGISKFFYKIVLFFWKLFKMHKECSCGVMHY